MEDKAIESTKNAPIVSFRKADILNGENVVIYDLDMEIAPGDFVYIVGKVGTGKTSIIRTMTGENPLLKGFGQVCGYKLNGLKDRDIPFLRRKIGVVFQDFQLLLTVHDLLHPSPVPLHFRLPEVFRRSRSMTSPPQTLSEDP